MKLFGRAGDERFEPDIQFTESQLQRMQLLLDLAMLATQAFDLPSPVACPQSIGCVYPSLASLRENRK